MAAPDGGVAFLGSQGNRLGAVIEPIATKFGLK